MTVPGNQRKLELEQRLLHERRRYPVAQGADKKIDMTHFQVTQQLLVATLDNLETRAGSAGGQQTGRASCRGREEIQVETLASQRKFRRILTEKRLRS